MNTTTLKLSLLALLIGMASVSVQADAAKCPFQALINLKTAFLKSKGTIAFSTLTAAIAIWVYKGRDRGAEWASRFNKSKLTTETLRQIWYFIADEILGHGGDVTKVKLQHITNDGIYETDAEKEICAPYGFVGSILGYAPEMKKTLGALGAVAAILAWVSAHEGQCPCALFASNK